MCLLVCLGFFNGFLKNLKNKMLLPTDTYLLISADLPCSWKTLCQIM